MQIKIIINVKFIAFHQPYQHTRNFYRANIKFIANLYIDFTQLFYKIKTENYKAKEKKITPPTFLLQIHHLPSKIGRNNNGVGHNLTNTYGQNKKKKGMRGTSPAIARQKSELCT